MQQQTKPFPKFWYESNATWGNVESLDDLAEKARLQISEPNSIKDLDGFLDRSKKLAGDNLRFGTGLVNLPEYTLRQFLADNGLLEDFVEHFNYAQRAQKIAALKADLAAVMAKHNLKTVTVDGYNGMEECFTYLHFEVDGETWHNQTVHEILSEALGIAVDSSFNT